MATNDTIPPPPPPDPVERPASPPPPPPEAFVPPPPPEDVPPPPPPAVEAPKPPSPVALRQKKGWGTVKPKTEPLSIEEILKKKREADAAAAKVCNPFTFIFRMTLCSHINLVHTEHS
jgi:ATP-dependent RNA helicase DDX23/PRP28